MHAAMEFPRVGVLSVVLFPMLMKRLYAGDVQCSLEEYIQCTVLSLAIKTSVIRIDSGFSHTNEYVICLSLRPA